MLRTGTAIPMAASIGLLVTTHQAVGDLSVTSDLQQQTVSQVFEAGQLVPVTFFAESDSQAGIFGVELAIKCASDRIRIASISFDPDFSHAFGRDELDLPGSRIKVCRTQEPANLNRTLGAEGARVPFATVEFEVVYPGAFESDIVIEARGSLIGESIRRTRVLRDAEAAESVSIRQSVPGGIRGTGMLTFRDTRLDDDTPWTLTDFDPPQQGVVSRSASTSSTSMTTLNVGQSYELRADSNFGRVDDYVLYVVADNPANVLASIAAPATGRWALADNLIFDQTAPDTDQPSRAGGYPEGFYGYQMVTDFFVPGAEESAEADTIGGEVLGMFSPQSPGPLNLQLMIYRYDLATHEAIQFEQQLFYEVVEAE